MRPFQIIFNPTSAAELARMPKELQLNILGEFRGLPQEVMSTDLERFGSWNGRARPAPFSIGDYRIYFERHELGSGGSSNFEQEFAEGFPLSIVAAGKRRRGLATESKVLGID